MTSSNADAWRLLNRIHDAGLRRIDVGGEMVHEVVLGQPCKALFVDVEMRRFEWPDEDDKSVEFQHGYGDWIRLLRTNNFEVLDLVELRAQRTRRQTATSLLHRSGRADGRLKRSGRHASAE